MSRAIAAARVSLGLGLPCVAQLVDVAAERQLVRQRPPASVITSSSAFRAEREMTIPPKIQQSETRRRTDEDRPGPNLI